MPPSTSSGNVTARSGNLTVPEPVEGPELVEGPEHSTPFPELVEGPRRYLPTLGEVAATVRRHAELLAGLNDERHGVTDLRKHMAWYFKGFPVGGELRRALASVSSLAELDELLARLDPDVGFPVSELGAPRGRQGTPRYRVALPEGWLDDDRGTDLDLREAEVDTSGG